MHVTAAFYRGKERASSRFLAWWARSDYSHCELILSRRGDLFECASSSMMDGGVRVKWIKLNPAHWELLDVPADPDKVRAWATAWEIDERAAALGMVRAWFDEHEGERYDLPGLLGFVVRRIKGWLRAWWCSEACTDALGWVDSWRFDVASFLALARTLGRPHRGEFSLT